MTAKEHGIYLGENYMKGEKSSGNDELAGHQGQAENPQDQERDSQLFSYSPEQLVTGLQDWEQVVDVPLELSPKSLFAFFKGDDRYEISRITSDVSPHSGETASEPEDTNTYQEVVVTYGRKNFTLSLELGDSEGNLVTAFSQTHLEDLQTDSSQKVKRVLFRLNLEEIYGPKVEEMEEPSQTLSLMNARLLEAIVPAGRPIESTISASDLESKTLVDNIISGERSTSVLRRVNKPLVEVLEALEGLGNQDPDSTSGSELSFTGVVGLDRKFLVTQLDHPDFPETEGPEAVLAIKFQGSEEYRTDFGEGELDELVNSGAEVEAVAMINNWWGDYDIGSFEEKTELSEDQILSAAAYVYTRESSYRLGQALGLSSDRLRTHSEFLHRVKCPEYMDFSDLEKDFILETARIDSLAPDVTEMFAEFRDKSVLIIYGEVSGGDSSQRMIQKIERIIAISKALETSINARLDLGTENNPTLFGWLRAQTGEGVVPEELDKPKLQIKQKTEGQKLSVNSQGHSGIFFDKESLEEFFSSATNGHSVYSSYAVIESIVSVQVEGNHEPVDIKYFNLQDRIGGNRFLVTAEFGDGLSGINLDGWPAQVQATGASIKNLYLIPIPPEFTTIEEFLDWHDPEIGKKVEAMKYPTTSKQAVENIVRMLSKPYLARYLTWANLGDKHMQGKSSDPLIDSETTWAEQRPPMYRGKILELASESDDGKKSGVPLTELIQAFRATVGDRFKTVAVHDESHDIDNPRGRFYRDELEVHQIRAVSNEHFYGNQRLELKINGVWVDQLPKEIIDAVFNVDHTLAKSVGDITVEACRLYTLAWHIHRGMRSKGIGNRDGMDQLKMNSTWRTEDNPKGVKPLTSHDQHKALIDDLLITSGVSTESELIQTMENGSVSETTWYDSTVEEQERLFDISELRRKEKKKERADRIKKSTISNRGDSRVF